MLAHSPLELNSENLFRYEYFSSFNYSKLSYEKKWM